MNSDRKKCHTQVSHYTVQAVSCVVINRTRFNQFVSPWQYSKGLIYNLLHRNVVASILTIVMPVVNSLAMPLMSMSLPLWSVFIPGVNVVISDVCIFKPIVY